MPEIVIQCSTAAPTEWFDRWILDRSKAICRITHSPFSHVDLMLPNCNLLGSSNNPRAPVISGNPSGVAIRPPEYQLFTIRRRAVIPCTQGQYDTFLSFCMDQLDKPFDTGALKLSTFLSGTFSNRDWRDPAKWYCAELMARAVEVSGLLKWKFIGIKNRISASDLLLMINPLIDVDLFWSTIHDLKLGRYET